MNYEARFAKTVAEIIGVGVTCYVDDLADGAGKRVKILRNTSDDMDMLMLVVSFTIRFMPSCYAVGIFKDMWIDEVYRHKGIGQAIHPIKLQYAKEVLGLQLLTCTVVLSNFPQLHIMHRNGWQVVSVFPRNENMVAMYKKELSLVKLEFV